MTRGLASVAARRGFARWASAGAVAATLAVLACAGAPTPGPAPGPAAASTGRPATPAATEVFNYGRFGAVQLRRPRGTVRSVALYLRGGAQTVAPQFAELLAEHGTLVASLDAGRYLEASRTASEACVQPAADLENLSHYLQSRAGLPEYLTPVLVGEGDGAALVYTTLAEAPEGLFRGAVSLGFCPQLPLVKPVCSGPALGSTLRRDAHGTVTGLTLLPAAHLSAHWAVLPDESAQACPLPQAELRRFVKSVPGAALLGATGPGSDGAGAAQRLEPYLAAFDRLAAVPASLPTPAGSSEHAALADLPLHFVPAVPHAEQPWFAVLLSGDGGWVGIDKGIAAALAHHGIPVVGWDSLKYYWKARTPDGAARDLARVLDHYSASLHKRRVLLVGYSQGADTLPFMINRLPESLRREIGLTALLGLSDNAVFEFHVANWLGDPPKGLPTAPELAAWHASPYLCIYGESDADAACAAITGHDGRVVKLHGGHHFAGRYAAVAAVILGDLPAG